MLVWRLFKSNGGVASCPEDSVVCNGNVAVWVGATVSEPEPKSRRMVRERALLVVLAFGMISAVVWSVFLAWILARTVIRWVF
jgi:hypothetical protein